MPLHHDDLDSRVLRARRARRALLDSEDAYGGIWTALGKGAVNVVRGATLQGRDPEEAAQEGGAGFLQSFRQEAGIEEPLMARLGKRVGSWFRRSRGGPVDPQDEPELLEGEDLPPVYAQDEALVLEGLEDPNLELSEAFGACLGYGSAPHPALRVPAARGLRRLGRAMPYSLGPMVRDDEAHPMLLEDGSVFEPVYGAMNMIACPSCAQAMTSEGCSICEGFGALLVPEDEMDGVASTDGWVGLRFPGPPSDFQAAPCALAPLGWWRSQ